jgi:hypothetical protein
MAVGGGGWVTGIDVASDGTKIARTDVGGGYVYNAPTSLWLQLVTNLSMPAGDVNPDFADGVYELRIAPSNTSRFYMIYVGWVYRSDNKGVTWTKTNFTRQASFLPTTFSNDTVRFYGEKIAVDPINADVAYISDPVNGWLWVTTDAGATWTHVTGVAAATDTFGITGICFDPAGGTSGGRTQKIYVNNGISVYVTTNAGTGWTALASPPARVRHAEVAAGFYYCCSDSSATLLYRSTGSGAWTTFNLAVGTIGGTQQGGANHGVTVDPANSAHIVVSDTGGSLAVSLDSGATWQGWAFGGTVTTGDVTWLANVNEVNFMSNGAVRYDPAQTNKLIFSEGIGVWTATPPTSSGASFNWQSMTKGIEELEAHGIVAPNGKPVLACQDRTIFYIADPTVYPSNHGAGTGIEHGWCVDYATADSNFMAMVSSAAMYKSTNGGQTWSSFTPTPYSFVNGGCIAILSSTSMMALNFSGSAVPSRYNGTAWSTPTYSPATPPTNGWSIASTYLTRRNLAADRVNGSTFYAFNHQPTGGLYRSTDGGATFTRMFTGFINTDATTGDAGFNVKLKAVPGNAGHLFFSNGQSGGWGDVNPDPTDTFWKSTDGGATWAKPNANLLEVYDIGFGMAKPGGSGYPAIFVVGWFSGVFGVWRSDDAGSTWSQVGASYPTGVLLYAGAATCIEGDPTVYNRCYLGFPGGGWAWFGV